jgi:hypothetical protein
MREQSTLTRDRVNRGRVVGQRVAVNRPTVASGNDDHRNDKNEDPRDDLLEECGRIL